MAVDISADALALDVASASQCLVLAHGPLLNAHALSNATCKPLAQVLTHLKCCSMMVLDIQALGSHRNGQSDCKCQITLVA